MMHDEHEDEVKVMKINGYYSEREALHVDKSSMYVTKVMIEEHIRLQDITKVYHIPYHHSKRPFSFKWSS